MTASIQTLVPYLVVLSHALFLFLVAAVIWRKSWGKKTFNLLGSKALAWGLLVALGAVSGSLFYSEVVGFAPCVLCWWQRVFIYPQLVLFAVALWKRDRGVFKYSAALSILAGIVALYHSYVYWGGESLLPCTALGGACAKIYVYAFGYITIPAMSLTIALYFLLLAWANRLYQRSSQ
jgi:disulfide bond formation protein DsbB